MPHPPAGRSARKRRAILEAATELFLGEGYRGTSMDQVAARAAVSKQTVYKHFRSKEVLFAAILQAPVERAQAFVDEALPALREARDVGDALRRLARRYLAVVMQPQVLQLRRLAIGEAERLPELARGYHERVPQYTLDALASSLRELVARGLLRAPDPSLAAAHFAFLVLGPALDRGMFYGADHGLAAQELDRLADEGVRAFLAAYGPA